MNCNKSKVKIISICLLVMLYSVSLVLAMPSVSAINIDKETNVKVMTIDVETIKKKVEDMPVAEKEDFYREKFDIPTAINIEPVSIDNLVKRNITDKDSFEEIADVTKIMEEEKREVLANELVSMNKVFVDRFSEKYLTNKTEIREQINNYLEFVKNRENIIFRIDSSNLMSLFKKEINMSTFINQIW